MKRITHVSISFAGKLYSLPEPYRHPHIIRCVVHLTGGRCGPDIQGFLDNDGEFVTRINALAIAKASGQFIDDGFDRGRLFSEDVWSVGVPFDKPVEEMLADLLVRDCTLTKLDEDGKPSHNVEYGREWH
jgi:hypothetical protein